MFRLAVCTALFIGAAALNDGALRSSPRATGFVRVLEFKHRLRVCNAYPYAAAIDVFRSEDEKLTKDLPMHYKTCKDFHTTLHSGDKLEFKVGDASAGTFSVSDLPNNDAILLLVIHRHDTLSTAVSFESHVFANLENAQVAIMDTYKGAARSSVKIARSSVKSVDTLQKDQSTPTEELRYDSVVAVNPGSYEVELVGSDGKAAAHSQFVALNRESYVIIRTGIEAQQGPAYPQELLIYPMSDISALHGSAVLRKASMAMFTVLLGMAHWW